MCFDLANSPDYDAENLSESGVASANCLIEGSGSIVYCCPRFLCVFFCFVFDLVSLYLLSVHHLTEERRAVFFSLIAFLLSCGY